MACSISLCVGLAFSSRSFAADMRKPGVQYPHWTAPCSTKAFCTGCSLLPLARPSTVMICAPCARGAGTRQAITALPSRNTVHAPHSPSAQPSFVPVNMPSSRSRRSNVLSCPLLKEYCFPLIVVSIVCSGNLLTVCGYAAFCFFPVKRIGFLGIPSCSFPSRIAVRPRLVMTRTISRR